MLADGLTVVQISISESVVLKYHIFILEFAKLMCYILQDHTCPHYIHVFLCLKQWHIFC